MHQHKNITIIGTSHIARESINEVKDQIENNQPDIIALELDPKRAYALLHKNNNNTDKK